MWRNTCECFATSVYFLTSPLGCQVAIYLVVRNFVEEGLTWPCPNINYPTGFRWPKQERLVVIANFEDNRRQSVRPIFVLSPPRVGKTAMPLAGARLLDSARQASAFVTIAAVTGWRFLYNCRLSLAER